MSDVLTLDDVCLQVVDCEHKTAPAAASGQEYGFSIGTPDIRNGRLLLDSAKPVDRDTFSEWTARTTPQVDDIILTREAPVGEAAHLDGVVPICLGQRTVLLRPNPRHIFPRYLHYRLLAPELQERMHAQSEGSTVAHLNVLAIRRLRLGKFPGLPEQRSIAETLGALDDKIAVNDRVAATYENLLRTRFEALQIDIDTDPAMSVPVSELIEFNPWLPAPSSADTVYLDMAAVPTTRATVGEWSIRSPKSGTRFANGDTVMARITPCLENGKTAFIDFMADGEVGIGSTEFIILRARAGVPVHLPYFLARSPRFRGHATRNMIGSSGRQRVSAAQLVDFPLARPDRSGMSTFGQIASTVFDHMKSLGFESRRLAQLRDSLLPRLLSGEIRVRDAEKVVEEAT